MKKVGNVLELYISQDKNRVKKDIISLDKDGVIEDKFHGKQIERSVLIASIHSYEMAKENGIDIKDGVLGENILIDYNIYDLQVGDKVNIGDVVLEITIPCTLCQGLSKVDPRLPKLLKKDRGIFAKVIKNGDIKINDQVSLKSL